MHLIYSLTLHYCILPSMFPSTFRNPFSLWDTRPTWALSELNQSHTRMSELINFSYAHWNPHNQPCVHCWAHVHNTSLNAWLTFILKIWSLWLSCSFQYVAKLGFPPEAYLEPFLLPRLWDGALFSCNFTFMLSILDCQVCSHSPCTTTFPWLLLSSSALSLGYPGLCYGLWSTV